MTWCAGSGGGTVTRGGSSARLPKEPTRARLPGSGAEPCAWYRAALHLVIWRNVFSELLLLERLRWSP